ncbi:tRNA-dihydrouridine synthase [Dechloromonas sp. XY25]|uniref:tRNA-dihydrouridine(16) synthase n=1 Tax=Dechloromonas hankyongensis TaxID=2908002 RepID=A0ABS9K524_9RHOO|nr:tRNA-dihydrouridine synthase [Dechloromonas hankyongensis]MCG2578184.1 tRNA-dihydrouridine synthase [Dechloromonas hankyongensis]
MSRILLAPMEGLADPLMRNVLTAVGGYDWGICEFIRVTESVLPNRTFLRTCPELHNGSRTEAGTPMRVQLLGSDPHFMAANARRLVKHRPAGVDINFGCPAPTVFRHRGGSALLGEPELLHDIVSAVRAMVPADIPFTAKMRLGIADSSLAVDCAQAIEAGGADELIVHGRTKVDGYKPPARWAQIDRVRAAVNIPIIANGEVWTVDDFRRCQQESGCADIMLGRGALADPLLPRKVRGEETGGWEELLPSVAAYWLGVRQRVLPVHAGGRIKQWLMLLRRHYPQAEALYQRLRPVKAAEDIDRLLIEVGVLDAGHDILPLAA